MSEEILKALMQLFAIIAKQDDGVEDNEIEFVKTFLSSQLNKEAVEEYVALFYKHAGINPDDLHNDKKDKKRQLTSVKDSVKILGICKKINKRLNQKQKVVVLVRLFELVNADRKFTEQRMAIINTVAEVFNIDPDEFESTESFVVESPEKISNPHILKINGKEEENTNSKHIHSEDLDGNLLVLQIKSVDLYFLRYTGNQDIFLNGLPLNNRSIYLFANGGTVKLTKGKPVYYSDVVAHFLADLTSSKISFNVNNVNFTFPNGGVGLRDIELSEEQGRLIGIMGASGAGKTTLLNVLTGMEKPSEGSVIINNINIHEEPEKIEGVIGSIPQDDLLISELTVYQNLYYNAKLCFKDKTEDEIDELVSKTLTSLGLYERKDLKVGSPLNKTISGGQRKRLNIALELIREPSILFVDEPTSGLSSRDSENVMDLLRELALKGKLIFVVIHQPSSDIYKMFDKMLILDTGGFQIYYGNPVEAVTYFKKLDNQINSDVGECPTCGNVNPELIFNIIDAKVVDEFGRYTQNRKVTPDEWEKRYKAENTVEKVPDVKENPPQTLNIPQWLSQFKIYTIRDFISKITNKQYVILNLLEAPLLGFILSFIIRYIEPDADNYIFRANANIPPYIFMALIVALFLGFMVSAEEIFKDRKILKREAFLNLSRSSYLISKILILFFISALQALLFAAVANIVLEIRGMFFEYWFALFTIAAFANMLGLNISSAFNSAVTIYIMIPLLMIPQMALGGAMFSFDKLNRNISSVDKVPVIAEFIAARWCYEALMVKQFRDNEFEKHFYQIDRAVSIGSYRGTKWTEEIEKRVDVALQSVQSNNDSIIEASKDIFELLRHELERENKRNSKITFPSVSRINNKDFNAQLADSLLNYLANIKDYYETISLKARKKKDAMIMKLDAKNPQLYIQQQNKYHNEAVSDIVKNIYMKQVVEYDNKLVRQRDPIFRYPEVEHALDFRSHFFAPQKHFLGVYMDTYYFDMMVVWLMTIVLYITLYYDSLKKLLEMTSK
ncbi:ABC transporter ATP-binding/permease protein [Salinivirga cyanobacteriivorans]|uniref:ABC transporter ATP-binding/permease protein n=1 Tax=Salinivirga cyanobacteriivorans TaxID=1307839 RepID=A0A0S2HZB1_9BACT|nr:ATP-binding cassette domain-containing protein [Salinivirga cyanobacteriivorans]ALO15407.1 ABC transporter ATP-binding/permease protein [Salinivirga cyanobacteriivorans]